MVCASRQLHTAILQRLASRPEQLVDSAAAVAEAIESAER